MHEASIVREILATAAERAAGARVMEVCVEVGRLSGVSPDALAFYFEILRGDTLGTQARLTVDLVPLQARCSDCGRNTELEDLAWTCPLCAGTLRFDGGAELELKSLVVEHG